MVVKQLVNSFSVPRVSFIKTVVENPDFTRNDLRVIMCLLTQLNGFDSVMNDELEPLHVANKEDSFKSIDTKKLSSLCNMSEKSFNYALNRLIHMNIVEVSETVFMTKGYRFRF